MAIYLFDEKRWTGRDYPANPSETLEEYADSIKGAVTDLIVMVYGHWEGLMGWSSPAGVKTSGRISSTKLKELVDVMGSRGVKVHAAFNVCRSDATLGLFPSEYPNSAAKLVDPTNPAFQTFITDLMRDCAAIEGIAGICLDFIRADYNDSTSTRISDAEGEENRVALANIARITYEKCRAVNPDCVLSSTTTPFKDTTVPLNLTGRRAIEWANAGYHDVCFEMNYGGGGWFEGLRYGGEQGDPPSNPPGRNLFEEGRALLNDPSKLVMMAGTYRHLADGSQFPTAPADFQLVLDYLKDEKNIALYTGWIFSNEQAELLRVRTVPEPDPLPDPLPDPDPDPTPDPEPTPGPVDVDLEDIGRVLVDLVNKIVTYRNK